MMKKWWMTMFLSMCCAIAGSLLIADRYVSAETAPIEVYVDEHRIGFSIDPYLEQGTTLVQLRPLFEALGISLDWEETTKTITGSKGADRFSLTIGQSSASINGKQTTLSVPGRVINGHTMVPLRFVSEAGGSQVGWQGDVRVIQVYSPEYVQILGIDEKEATRRVTSTLPASRTAHTGEGLQGFYAAGYADLLGNRCRGMCWDYYYFFNDQQLITQPPPIGGVDCSEQSCLSYEVNGDELIIDGERRYRIEPREDSMIINGRHFMRHDPMLRPVLDGSYTSSSYTTFGTGGGFASSSVFIFQPDGTFYTDGFIGVMTDGSDAGDGSGVSTTHLSNTDADGRYAVINHHILLTYRDGTSEQFLFFRPDGNDRMYKIGGRDFLIADDIDPATLGNREAQDDTETVTEPPEVESNEPYPDLLTTAGGIEKTIVLQRNPQIAYEAGDVEIELHGYQWAELDIPADSRHTFTGFGDGTIVALTAKYTIANTGIETLDLSEMGSAIWLADGHTTASAHLAPTQSHSLEAGESEERLAVFLFPKEMISEYYWFELVFSNIWTDSGEDALDDDELSFDVIPAY